MTSFNEFQFSQKKGNLIMCGFTTNVKKQKNATGCRVSNLFNDGIPYWTTPYRKI